MLNSLPEELLARILALAVPRHNSDTFPTRNRTAPLLVSRQFFRIASPFFYHTLRFHAPHQPARVRDTLARHPALASTVRRIVFDGIWHHCAGLLALCDHVQDVDICLDGGPAGEPDDVDADAFCTALERRRTITHLTIRKCHAVYLTHPRPIYVLQRLTQAVHQWSDLETVHFAFRISSTANTLPLARALSVSPRLRCVRAQIPAAWNNFLLVLSANPALEKVMLYTESASGLVQTMPTPLLEPAVIKEGYICDDIEHAILGTGLYMMEAKKHPRLSELIKTGTWIVRTRAHTTIVSLSTTPAGGTPLGAVRAKELADELMSNCDMTVAQPPTYVHARAVMQRG